MPTDTPPILPESVRSGMEVRTRSDDLELPVLPETASRVISMCSSEHCDARQLARLIERDQSLAGHVLRISNAAAFAPNQAIVSLQQAVARLGNGTLCEITMGIAMRGEVFRVPGFDETVRAMWRHSALAGAFAKEIARAVRHNVESAFLCGLLHDVGKPVVLSTLIAVLKEANVAPNRELIEAALAQFHAPVGAMLVDSWGLSPWVVSAAEHHHDPSAAAAHAVEVHVACLADQFAHWITNTREETEAAVRRSPALALLDLYDDDMDRIFAAKETVIQVAEAFA